MAVLIEERSAVEITAWGLTLTTGWGFVTLCILIVYASDPAYPNTPDFYKSSPYPYGNSSSYLSVFLATSFCNSAILLCKARKLVCSISMR